jgi:hypothetical protein
MALRRNEVLLPWIGPLSFLRQDSESPQLPWEIANIEGDASSREICTKSQVNVGKGRGEGAATHG